MKKFILEWYTRAMTEAEVNSRLVFLFSNVVVAACLVSLVIGFMCSKTINRELYPSMVAAVGAGGLGTAAGRLLTKIGDKKTDIKAAEGNTDVK